ncbi:MAG: OmpH family outer membrane protein [Elusimicrobiota bacterium]|jgi:Skp family chaperone for outer membrane proteins
MKKSIIAAILLAVACRAGAIELSLEENRAERGNIGFVDMQRIFKLFPETLKAKEAFEEAVRQAEEQLNLRKTDTLKLRAELEALKAEREAAAKAPPAPALAPLYPTEKAPVPQPAPAPAAAAAPAASAPTPPPAPAPAADSSLQHMPGFVAATTTGPVQAPAASEQPLTINLPGATTGPVVVSAPAGAAAAAPVPPPAPAPAAAPSRLQELDDKLAQKTQELERKETESRQQQATTEKNLLDLESRRSEVLLGKIYHAVQEVSRREGIIVVVDKSGILYGQSAVDLTEKVLKQLKGS